MIIDLKMMVPSVLHHLQRERCDPPVTNLKSFLTTTEPQSPMHEYHKQDQGQGATLEEASTHWKEMPLVLYHSRTVPTLGKQGLDGPEKGPPTPHTTLS